MLRSMRFTTGLVASLFLLAALVGACEPSEDGEQPPPAPQQAPQQ